jgi:cation transport ATPase
MALEPLLVRSGDDTSELDDMSRRLWVCVALSLPLLALAMSELMPGIRLHQRVAPEWLNWAQGALGTLVVLWGVGRS